MSSIAVRPPPFSMPRSYAQPVQPEIIGTDDRRHVTDTTKIPFRFICCIDRYFVKTAPDEPRRTSGVLISPKHVLTVGHSVLSPTFGAVSRMNVAVARNGRATPFGMVAAAAWRAHPNWVASFNNQQFDIALITLATPVGNSLFSGRRLGWWGDPSADGGGTRLSVIDPARLTGVATNVSGYPGDKCDGAQLRDQHACTNAVQHPGAPATCPPVDTGSTQWCSFASIRHPIVAATPGLLDYDMDTKGGHSGSPVWVRWRNARTLVGIHRGVDCGSGLNIGVRLTAALWTTIRSWM